MLKREERECDSGKRLPVQRLKCIRDQLFILHAIDAHPVSPDTNCVNDMQLKQIKPQS